jgi:hypothetical protein
LFGFGRDDIFDDAPSAGAILDFDLSLLRDSAGLRRIGVIHWNSDFTLHMSFTPAQARQLAAWLRLAATPGRTIADAKRNQRKAP